jgi:chemotaxis protein MotB
MSKHDDHEEEHENHERWLVSYADFITLLFAFFVVMYAISSVDQKRVVAVERSVRWALHIQGQGGGGEIGVFSDPQSNGSTEMQQMQQNEKTGSADAAKGVANARGSVARRIARRMAARDANKVLVIADGERLIVRVSATHLFGPGGYVLEPGALATLDAIAIELAALNKPVRVEGHSDGTRGNETDNWLLSARRASAVVAYLDDAHLVPADRLSMAAYGDKRPIAQNDDADGRAENRRVEFVVDMH